MNDMFGLVGDCKMGSFERIIEYDVIHSSQQKENQGEHYRHMGISSGKASCLMFSLAILFGGYCRR